MEALSSENPKGETGGAVWVQNVRITGGGKEEGGIQSSQMSKVNVTRYNGLIEERSSL